MNNILSRIVYGETATPAAAPAPAIAIATQHIPFVENLWTRLQAAREQVAAKETYVREARQFGDLAAVQRVAEATKDDRARVERAAGEYDRIRRLLTLGAEPTTPPERWYCGLLAQPKPLGVDRWGEEHYANETWPSFSLRRTVAVFQGAMPLSALRRYSETKALLDDVRVYSPREADFRQMPEPELLDPVLIGAIDFFGDRQYFELARWDIDQDLATVFGRIGGAR